MTPINDLSSKVICPFYQHLSAGGREIVCEGIETGIKTCTLFGTRDDRDKWLRKHCFTYTYDRCPVAEGVLKKIQKKTGS